MIIHSSKAFPRDPLYDFIRLLYIFYHRYIAAACYDLCTLLTGKTTKQTNKQINKETNNNELYSLILMLLFTFYFSVFMILYIFIA